MIKLRLYDTWDEICLGIYTHKVLKVKHDREFSDEFTEEFSSDDLEEGRRIVIGFLIFGIDIIT